MTMIFYLTAAVALLATALAITRQDAVHALLYLVVSLLAVALLLFLLGAPFAAALEVIVYAGAIMVLILFVIMLLNLPEEVRRPGSGFFQKVLGVVFVAAFAAAYALLRGGEPYIVRGAGMVHDDIERFAAHGGNAIRTWTTRSGEVDIPALLDTAQAHGVTVALTLPMRPERHGFDYDDPDAVAEQLAALREDVLRYRDHPALLLWIIGNELNHSYTNPAVWDAVNDVAEMIHELDPDHRFRRDKPAVGRLGQLRQRRLHRGRRRHHGPDH